MTQPKTAQEIVNFVALELRKQGQPSQARDSRICLYRGPKGRKCAAGWLIPDELMTDDINNANSSACHDFMAHVWKQLELQEHVPLITDLQEAHDEAAISNYGCEGWVDQFNTLLQKVCLNHGLNYPEPPETI